MDMGKEESLVAVGAIRYAGIKRYPFVRGFQRRAAEGTYGRFHQFMTSCRYGAIFRYHRVPPHAYLRKSDRVSL